MTHTFPCLATDVDITLQGLRWLLSHLETHKDSIAIIILAPTAFWAVWTYHKAKKKESAEWLHKLFTSFYLSEDVYPIRTAIEFESETKLRPIIERMLIDKEANTTEQERRVLCDLDTLLNYFEFILYLEENGQIKKADCEKLFDYWFSLLKEPAGGYLRLYCHRFGYEGLCEKITGNRKCSEVPEYIAFYGSLMESDSKQDELEVKTRLKFVGPCEIRGRLYDLGEYPALVAGDARVKAELYRVTEPRVFRRLDKYEEFDIRHPEDSLFVRHFVRLAKPPCDAWVYFYNQPVSNRPLISENSWAEYRRDKHPTS